MIFHIAKKSEWENAVRTGSYAPASVGAEGFIHCSTRAQLLGTANLIFRGQQDLVVLSIDEKRLVSTLKYEGPSMPGIDERERENGDRLFPHIYGSLNPDAVTRVIEFPCGSDGRFAMPAELQD